MATSSYWKKRALERLTDAEKIGDDYIRRVSRIYNQANRNIKKEISNIYLNYFKETGVDITTLKTLLSKSATDKFWTTLEGKGLKEYVKNNYKARISRLEQLQGQIYARAKEIAPLEYTTTSKAYKDILANTYNKVIYDTQIGTGYGFTFNKIDNRLIDTFLNTKLSGKNYSERIWANTDILADKLTEILGGALTSGQSYAKTAREIQDAFKISKYYAERLIRTETNYFHNQAQLEAYEEMGVDEYIFEAVLDNRTSLICQELDKKVFKVKDQEVGKNYPPMHPNCRSTTDAYLGEEYEPISRRARNPKTNEVELVGNISYKEWIKKYED